MMSLFEAMEDYEQKLTRAQTIRAELKGWEEELLRYCAFFKDFPDGSDLATDSGCVAETLSSAIEYSAATRENIEYLIRDLENKLEPLYETAGEWAEREDEEREGEYRGMVM